jgi:hypothetical protein
VAAISLSFIRPEGNTHVRYTHTQSIGKLEMYPWAFIKDVQATEEAFSPQKRTSSTSKLKNFFTFFNFCGSFLLS